ncbi:MAG TPA: glutamate--tRNA ligase [Allosphingosinicella sp.]
MSAENEPRAVVTRFAPSPTGFLHIGNARTGLFSWLYARHHKGKALLRIEDTDKARSTQAAIDVILDGLTWLGIDWDGEAVFQSDRLARHAIVAHELLAKGEAYRCYMIQEELAAARAAAERERRPFRLESPWRDCSPDAAAPDRPYVVRLKAPREGETVIDDLVQGRVTVRNAELDDMILLRSDGTPTYMLAVVVDDHDMGVTHVIRGDDHLNNAFRQLGIVKAMGWLEPVYAHIPLIHGPDGAKLSKRHGALAVDAYREMGYLPEAMRNYLLRLGWSHGNDEIISTEQAIAWFDLEHIGRSPARFDFKKLDNVNAHYIRASGDAVLVEIVAALLARRQPPCVLTESAKSRLLRLMPSLKERAKTLVEMAEAADFLYADGPRTLDAAAEKVLSPEARQLLGALLQAIGSATWDASTLEQAARAYADSRGLKLGQVAQPLRVAVTGRTTSPPIFEVLAVLGRDESLARLRAYAT